MSELAQVQGAGGVAKAAISRLIADAKKVLLSPSGYLARRYPADLEVVRRSLREDAAEAWVPGGQGPSAFEAALRHISGPGYVTALVQDLAQDAAEVNAVEGEVDAVKRLSKVEQLVELLDAELAHDGHSIAWRRKVAAAARASHSGGASLGEAISGALEANRYRQMREFDVLVPSPWIKEPPGGAAGLKWLDPELATSEIVESWRGDGAAEVLRHPKLVHAEAIARYRLEAADTQAAGREVSRRFERDRDLWRLRGGDFPQGEVAFVFDRETLTVSTLELPAEPLDLLPRTLGNYGSDPEGEVPLTTVDDALLLLARARTSSPATALVNVWSAAEALFGGAVGDVGADAGWVMASMAELIYVRDMLRWLGERFTAAGIEGEPAGGSSTWALDVVVRRTTDVLAALNTRGDAVGWWRLKSITRWDTTGALRGQLTAFTERMAQVGTRAYLVRNLVLHRAHLREQALSVTLPVIAALVRECVGHVAGGDPAKTLTEAKLAAIAVRHAVSEIDKDPSSAARLVRSLLL